MKRKRKYTSAGNRPDWTTSCHPSLFQPSSIWRIFKWQRHLSISRNIFRRSPIIHPLSPHPLFFPLYPIRPSTSPGNNLIYLFCTGSYELESILLKFLLFSVSFYCQIIGCDKQVFKLSLGPSSVEEYIKFRRDNS